MPENLDYEMYLNVAFFGVIALGFIFGYLRGLKKSLYSLVTMFIFYALFFYTIDVVIDAMWNTPNPAAIQQLAAVDSAFGSASSLGDALTIGLNTYLGETLTDSTLSNEVFLSLATGLAQFVLKLAYTLLYFTAGTVIYKFIMFVIRLIFFSGGKKNKGKSKHRLLGAAVGAAKGCMAVFVTMIMLGGLMNLMDSVLVLLPDDTNAAVSNSEVIYLSNTYPEYQAMDNTVMSNEQEEIVNQAKDMVAAYNSNLFVSTASTITLEHDDYQEAVPLNLYLFDSVLSFSFQEDKVYLRKEVQSLSGVASLFMNSDFADTNDYTDITKDEVIGVFDAVANSDFIVNVIPLAIEVGSDYMDVPVEVPTEELYEIDWATELSNLGVIAGVGFDILNTAGMLEEDPDFETVEFDGTKVKDLFDSMAESDLITMGAALAVEPLLEGMDGQISTIITIPEGMDWEAEFQAFGLVAKEVLDQQITMADLQAEDKTELITVMAGLDFTVLLDSQLVSHALKNIFSGDAGIEGLDMIIVPDDTVWFDVLNLDGSIQTPGELRNILNAINAIVDVVDDFSLEEMDINMIADLSDDAIDTVFNSMVLVATISDYLLNMDLGDTPLIIPDSVLDANDYILKAEMKKVASSAKVLVTDLACDEGDTECADGTGFDFGKAFDLSDASIDKLLDSDILGASVGQLVIDQAGDMLTIPASATTSLTVDGTAKDVVAKDEIKSMFKAVSVLGFTDMEGMEFDASFITNLAEDADDTELDHAKTAKLFASKIIHATISDMLFEQTSGVDSTLVVPRLKQDNLTEVITYDAGDDLDYLDTTELDAILQALITLDISDFTAVDSLDINTVIDNSGTLLESAILQATISNQLLDLGDEGTIIIPVTSADDDPITIVVDTGENEVTYIDKDEIVDVLDVLKLLEIDDINNFDGQVDIATIIGTEGNIDIMLESAIIHATISDQLIGVDAIVVPIIDDLDNNIRFMKGTTEYVSADEITNTMDALNALEITDVESFGGTVPFDKFFEEGNSAIILSSATIRATMSKQIIDLDADDTLSLPYFDETGAAVRITKGTVEFVRKSELEALIDALDILEMTNIEEFGGTIPMDKINEGDNFDTLIESAMIQATISEQVLDLDDNPTLSADFVVPYVGFDDVSIRISVGNELEGTNTTYITQTELSNLMDAMDLLGASDVTTFDGSVDLATFYTFENRETLFDSAIMHATISEQIFKLDGDVLNVPQTDVAGTALIEQHGVGLEAIDYITRVELHATIESLELLGVGDVNEFDGLFDFEDFDEDSEQNVLLASGLIHYTVSTKIFNLSDDALIVPAYTELGETPGNEIIMTVAGTDFVVKTEVKALINAFNVMAYDNIEDLGTSLDSTEFFTNKETLLASSSIQATLSDKMLTGTGDVLVVPDQNADTLDLVRIVQTDVIYIEKDEMLAIMTALEEMGLTDFTTMDFNPTAVFSANKATLLASATIQATISDTILPNADDETAAPGGSSLIVPTEFRQDLLVNSATVKQIEKVELLALLNALDTLGVADFNGGMSGSTITGLTATDIDVLLVSGSLHTTIDNMFRSNANITSNIHPATMEYSPSYKSNILYKAEIKAFILATKEMSATDFSTVTFDITLLSTIGSASSRDTIFTSMIIRNALNDQVVTLASNPLDPYPGLPLVNGDYTGGNASDPDDYLNKSEFLLIVEHISPATS